MRFTTVFFISALVLSAVVLLLPVIQKALKTRTALRTAGTTATNVWTHGTDEQRKAMLEFIDITEGSHRDSLLTKVWDDIPEPARTSIVKNFLR